MFNKKDMLKATKRTTLVGSVKETHLPWRPLQIYLTGHHPVYKKIKILDDNTKGIVLNFWPTLTYLSFQITLQRRCCHGHLLQMKKLSVREVKLYKAT